MEKSKKEKNIVKFFSNPKICRNMAENFCSKGNSNMVKYYYKGKLHNNKKKANLVRFYLHGMLGRKKSLDHHDFSKKADISNSLIHCSETPTGKVNGNTSKLLQDDFNHSEKRAVVDDMDASQSFENNKYGQGLSSSGDLNSTEDMLLSVKQEENDIEEQNDSDHTDTYDSFQVEYESDQDDTNDENDDKDDIDDDVEYKPHARKSDANKGKVKPVCIASTNSDVNLYQCDQCNDVFTNKKKLKSHRKIHEQGKKTYHCDICNSVYYFKSVYKKHKLTAHSIKVDDSEFVDEQTCKVCGKYLKTKEYLREHMKIHTGEKPFQCNLCSKSFPNKRALKLHQHTHNPGTDYECDICGKKFGILTILTKHRKSHDQFKHHCCGYCGKKFQHKTVLEVHERTHTGERPYICEVGNCNK